MLRIFLQVVFGLLVFSSAFAQVPDTTDVEEQIERMLKEKERKPHVITEPVPPSLIEKPAVVPAPPKRKYSFMYGFDRPYIPPKDSASKKKIVYPKGGIFSGATGIQASRLNYIEDSTGASKSRLRSTLMASLNIRIYKQLQLETSFFYHIKASNHPPLPIWLSDVYYSLKWANWRPYTFSFGYENYADNRYNHTAKEWGERFLQGYGFVSFNAAMPAAWVKKIRLDQSTNFVIIPMVRYFPAFRNATNDIVRNKMALSLSGRYTIWFRLYVEGGAHYYPIANTRMPWDPDFTYGFGYFDYRPWRVSVTYGNWIANRFNMKPELSPYGFADGNLSILFNYKF